jgi:hypothetical protein
MEQIKFGGSGQTVRHGQTGASLRNIAHRAIENGASIVEEHLCRFEHAVTPGRSLFGHGAPPA